MPKPKKGGSEYGTCIDPTNDFDLHRGSSGYRKEATFGSLNKRDEEA
jgi:hypothetical protein